MNLEPKQPHLPLGTMVDEMYTIRNQRSELARQDKALTAEYEALAAQVMAALDEQETTMTRAKTASAIITEETVAQVDNWDLTYEYIKEHSAFYLLQRRFNNAAWREITESGDTVPGTVPVKVRKIAVRKI
jgi:predicted RNase H-like nuclease (RuvC/YqgF family)